MRALLIHQSSELYGSDRSFLAAVEGLRLAYPTWKIDAVLPDLSGPLVSELRGLDIGLTVDEGGYLRKVLLRRPHRLIYALLRSALSLSKRMKSYDLVYINTVVCVSAILAARFHPRAVVHVREIPSGVAATVFRALLRWSRAAFVYNSRATSEAFGLAGQVVYNGIPEPDAQRQEVLERSAADAASSSLRRFLIIGRISEWKGQQFVIDALRTVEQPLELVILGNIAPGREAYEQQLRDSAQLLQRHKVRFVGFVSNPDAFYREADFILVPSLLPEPFGRVAVEAMAYGKPPIVADHGGLVEIVESDHVGLRFKAGDSQSLIAVIGRCLSMRDSEYERRATDCRSIFRQRFGLAAYQSRMATLLGGRINA